VRQQVRVHFLPAALCLPGKGRYVVADLANRFQALAEPACLGQSHKDGRALSHESAGRQSGVLLRLRETGKSRGEIGKLHECNAAARQNRGIKANRVSSAEVGPEQTTKLTLITLIRTALRGERR
jgi:hypothetical protein